MKRRNKNIMKRMINSKAPVVVKVRTPEGTYSIDAWGVTPGEIEERARVLKAKEKDCSITVTWNRGHE